MNQVTTLPLLGLIAPPSPYPVPEEARTLYGSEVRFSTVGLGLLTMTPAGYDSVIDKIVPAAEKLAEEGSKAILLLGTSLTFYRGAAFNHELTEKIRKATNLPATTMSTAIVEGLKAVGSRRLAIATAYNDEVNRRLKDFLAENGFEVLALKGLGLEKTGVAGTISHERLQEFSAGVFKSAPGADALLISCGGLRTLEILVPLEEETGVPVVSSTPHALWAGVRLLGLSGRLSGNGRLLEKQ
jgi:arylmalonate decarboxylase